ncbi:MAG: pantoate kinase [Candidatus Bathyarchaeia archaeon]|jgi:pantoate kinase
MQCAKAFAPAGLSSFFEICDQTDAGVPIADPERVGARGGGFGLKHGVLTELSLSEAKKNNIRVFLNGNIAPEAETTRTALRMLLNRTEKKYDVVVHHKICVPVGAGFGTSAGGALTAALAFSKAASLPLTFNQIGKIAHVAEVLCKTGLGTVGALMVSGCVLTVEPGAPGISVIDRIPLSPDYAVVVGFFGPTPTRQVLSSAEKRVEINRHGRRTLEAILDEPTLENFLACCWDFSEKTGFATERIRQLARLAQSAGAIGYAQNMVGEALHAVVFKENAADVVEVFKQVLPQEGILVSTLDFQGARLLDTDEAV